MRLWLRGAVFFIDHFLAVVQIFKQHSPLLFLNAFFASCQSIVFLRVFSRSMLRVAFALPASSGVASGASHNCFPNSFTKFHVNLEPYAVARSSGKFHWNDKAEEM